MAVDKSRTPMWMKVVIWVVAASFVGGGVIVAGSGGGSSSSKSSSGESSTATNTASSIAAQYKPAIDAADTGLKSTPENYDSLVTQGNNYYDWAAAVVNASIDPSVSNSLFISAADFYTRATETSTTAQAAVWGDRAFALYYGGSADAKAALEDFMKKDAKDTTGQLATAKSMLTDLKTQASTETTAQ